MKRKIFSAILAIFLVAGITDSLNAQSAEEKKADAPAVVRLYDPTLDGMKQIKDASVTAKNEGKHVLIQYGGNWCSWCIKFDAFCKADGDIMKVIEANYVPVKMNYDPSNKNDAANEYMGNPTRFGFPVFIIIDGNGKVIHIQNSALLEEGAGYNKNKVLGFFTGWTPSALIPQSKKAESK